MIGVRWRLGRAAVVLAGVACAGGMTACDGGGSGTAVAPAAGATASVAATPGAKPSSGSGATAADTQPCDLLTRGMAGRILGKTVPAPDMSSPTMCEYSMSGADYGDSVALAVEKWQDGRTVEDEVRDLGMVGSDGASTQQSVSGLSPDAVVVSDDSDITVVWKAGDVQKIHVSTDTDLDGTRDRLLDVARQIYTAEQG